MHTAKVLGLDGSLQNFGLAVATVNLDSRTIISVDDLVLSKTVKALGKGVKRSHDDLNRFRQHWYEINNLISKYNIELAVGEVPTGAQDARAAFAFGGVTALLAALPITLTEVTPSEVKIAATGHKHADKEDVIAWAYKNFPTAKWNTSKLPNKMDIRIPSGEYLTNNNEHLADAVAAILAGITK